MIFLTPERAIFYCIDLLLHFFFFCLIYFQQRKQKNHILKCITEENLKIGILKMWKWKCHIFLGASISYYPKQKEKSNMRQCIDDTEQTYYLCTFQHFKHKIKCKVEIYSVNQNPKPHKMQHKTQRMLENVRLKHKM